MRPHFEEKLIRREIYQKIIWPTSAAVSYRDDIHQIYIYYGANFCLLVPSGIYVKKECAVFHGFWGYDSKKDWRLSQFNENCETKKKFIYSRKKTE